MPVKDPTVYGVDWPHLSFNIVFRRAGGRCECCGECGRDPATSTPTLTPTTTT
jgi:hypothetical protein